MMDRDSIRRSLLAYLEEDQGEPMPPLDDGVEIRDGLGLDSVDIVGMVMQVEREFRVRLATEELAAIVTVGDLLDLLQARIAEEPAARDAA